jgi:hypothetical protein
MGELDKQIAMIDAAKSILPAKAERELVSAAH